MVGVIGYAAVVFALLAAIRGVTRRQQQFEHAADELAARWGYEVTAGIGSELEIRARHTRWLPGWLRGHPLPSERIRPRPEPTRW